MKDPHCTGMCLYHKSWHLAAWNILHLVNLYLNFCTMLKPPVLVQGSWWNEHHAQGSVRRRKHMQQILKSGYRYNTTCPDQRINAIMETQV